MPRDLELSYSSTYWNLTARAVRYQTLELPDSTVAIPYDKVPEFELEAARLDYGGFDFGLTGFATRFETIGAVGGDRFVLNPSISYPIVGAGWFVRPKVSYNSTSYALTDQAPGLPNSFNRNVPTPSVWTRAWCLSAPPICLITTMTRHSSRVCSTSIVPFRNQSQLPDFDSSIPGFQLLATFRRELLHRLRSPGR